jgi:hypothetical protein
MRPSIGHIAYFFFSEISYSAVSVTFSSSSLVFPVYTRILFFFSAQKAKAKGKGRGADGLHVQ